MTEDVEVVDISGLSVLFAIPCYRGSIPIDATAALMATAATLREMGVKVGFAYERENALIDSCRDVLVDRFMKDTDYDKMFFIDDDIVWNPQDVVRMLAMSVSHPVVCATYPVRQDAPLFYVSFYGKQPMEDKYGLMPITGCGMGFCVIDRGVFDALAPASKTYKHKGRTQHRYFKVGVKDGVRYREDNYFFKRCVKRLGPVVFLDPTIELQHFGTKSYSYKFREYLAKQTAPTDDVPTAGDVVHN